MSGIVAVVVVIIVVLDARSGIGICEAESAGCLASLLFLLLLARRRLDKNGEGLESFR